MSVSTKPSIPACKVYDSTRDIEEQLISKGQVKLVTNIQYFPPGSYIREYVPLITLEGTVKVYAVFPSIFDETLGSNVVQIEKKSYSYFHLNQHPNPFQRDRMMNNVQIKHNLNATQLDDEFKQKGCLSISHLNVALEKLGIENKKKSD